MRLLLLILVICGVKSGCCHLSATRLAWRFLHSAHKPAFHGNVVACLACRQRHFCPAGHFSVAVRAWMRSPCPGADALPTPHPVGLAPVLPRPVQVPAAAMVMVAGTVLHPSHQLMQHRGLYYCSLCGYVAGHRALKLVQPCTGGNCHSRRVVARILRDRLPPGTPCWPEVGSRARQVQLVL